MFGKARRLEAENTALKAELAAAQARLENPFYSYAEQLQADVAAGLRDGRGDVAVQDAVSRMTRQTREAAINHRIKTDPIESLVPIYSEYLGKEFVIGALERLMAERRIPIEAEAKKDLIKLQARRGMFDFANLAVGQVVTIGLYRDGFIEDDGYWGDDSEAARLIKARVDDAHKITHLTVIGDEMPNGKAASLTQEYMPTSYFAYPTFPSLDLHDHDVIEFGTVRRTDGRSFSHVTYGTRLAIGLNKEAIQLTAYDLGYIAVDGEQVIFDS